MSYAASCSRRPMKVISWRDSTEQVFLAQYYLSHSYVIFFACGCPYLMWCSLECLMAGDLPMDLENTILWRQKRKNAFSFSILEYPYCFSILPIVDFELFFFCNSFSISGIESSSSFAFILTHNSQWYGIL